MRRRKSFATFGIPRVHLFAAIELSTSASQSRNIAEPV